MLFFNAKRCFAVTFLPVLDYGDFLHMPLPKYCICLMQFTMLFSQTVNPLVTAANSTLGLVSLLRLSTSTYWYTFIHI